MGEDVEREAATRSPKIIFVNRFYHPDTSATAQLLHDVTAHLAGAHPVVVIAGSRRIGGDQSPLARQDWVDGVEVRRVWSLSHGNGSTLRKLVAFVFFYPLAFVALLQIVRPGDVLVTKTDPPLLSVIGMIIAKARGAVLVTWLQDLYPEVAIRVGTPLLQGPVGRVLAGIRNWSLRVAHTNVVIGQLMASEIAQHGIVAERIRVIPNWADEEAIRPMLASASTSRKDWEIPENTFVVGYSGNLGRAHEIETICGAAHQLRHRRDILFLFVGGGSGNSQLLKLVKDQGLSNCVFKPYQPQHLLGDSLAAADVHWISLRPELEGLIVPSKLYGVLAAARPIIAVTDPDGEVASMVRQSGCGLVVRPGNVGRMVAAIEGLSADHRALDLMGTRSRELAVGPCARKSALGQWSSLVREIFGENGKSEDRNRRRRGVRTGPIDV